MASLDTIINIKSAYDKSLAYQIEASTEIGKGDLVYCTNGYVYKMTQATQDIAFAGVALENSSENEIMNMNVSYRCSIFVDCATATYHIGDSLKLSATNKVVADGGANTLVWVAETPTSFSIATNKVSNLKCVVDVFALQKFFSVNT